MDSELDGALTQNMFELNDCTDTDSWRAKRETVKHTQPVKFCFVCVQPRAPAADEGGAPIATGRGRTAREVVGARLERVFVAKA